MVASLNTLGLVGNHLNTLGFGEQTFSIESAPINILGFTRDLITTLGYASGSLDSSLAASVPRQIRIRGGSGRRNEAKPWQYESPLRQASTIFHARLVAVNGVRIEPIA